MIDETIIYGCMGLGGKNWDDTPLTKDQRNIAFTALEAAMEQGVRSFDHANIYACGKSESVFGEYLKEHRLDRNDIVVQSKAGIRRDANTPFYDFSAEHLKAEVSKSIDRLQCDYLDRFFLHRPDVFTPVHEVAETLNNLLKEGSVKSIGVSNCSPPFIDELNLHLDQKIKSSQIPLNLLQTDPLDEELNWFNERPFAPSNVLYHSRHNYMTLQAYAPLCRGLLSADSFSDSAWGRDLQQARRVCRSLEKKYSCSTESLLIAFLLQIPFSVAPVIGTTNARRVKACVAAKDLSLEKQDLYKLIEAGRPGFLP